MTIADSGVEKTRSDIEETQEELIVAVQEGANSSGAASDTARTVIENRGRSLGRGSGR